MEQAMEQRARRIDFGRLERGDIISGIGGLVLLVSLFLPWFSVDLAEGENLCGATADTCTAWQTFNILDFLLLAGCAAPFILVWIIIRGHELSWPPGEVTAIVGITATALILYNGLIDRVGTERSAVHLDVGWYVGLAGGLILLLGAANVQMIRGGAPRRPPGVFR
jgi:hypothetical protein